MYSEKLNTGPNNDVVGTVQCALPFISRKYPWRPSGHFANKKSLSEECFETTEEVPPHTRPRLTGEALLLL